MAIQTITYDDKVALNENASVADINKVTDDDMNEIKNVVNNNASETSTNTTNITINTNDITSLKKLVPTILFDASTGSTGTITLSDSSANYSYLEIYFYTNDGWQYKGYQKCMLEGSNATYHTLIATWTDTSGRCYLKAKNISISGNTISNIGYAEVNLSGGAPTTTASNDIYIRRVLGYK